MQSNNFEIKDLPSTLKQHKLDSNDYEKIKKILGREPNLLEIGIFSAMWSEHCSYKSSKIYLRNFPISASYVLQGPGENAGVIDLGANAKSENLAAVFKIESHNHPSFIEPNAGAATGVGGILRDIFTMGANPIANLNYLCFGDILDSKQRAKHTHLLKGAVDGISHYGNCMGVPTIGGQTHFEPCYNGNILVNAFSLGIVEKEQIFKGKASGAGNPIIYIGSKTGRDGLGGAVMSSDSFNVDSKSLRPAVQIGDPFIEKQLLEACLKIFSENLIIGIQDMGAAGLTSSSFEMASRAKSGMILHLEKVPQRESGMNAYELMLSESQERMLLCAKSGSESRIKEICRFYNLECEIIGEVVELDCITLMWNDEICATLNVSSVVDNAPILNRPLRRPKYISTLQKLDLKIESSLLDSKNNKFLVEILQNLDSIDSKDSKASGRRHAERSEASIKSKKVTESITPKILEIQDALKNKEILNAIFKDMLANLEINDKNFIYTQYDSTIKSSTIKAGGMGDASIISLKNYASQKALSMSVKCNPRYCYLNPREGAKIAVAMSGRNVALSGAKPLAITDCLNFGSPENSGVMWQFKETCEGIKEACESLKTPVISGNVSLYNQTGSNPIYPTPTIVNVGMLEDYSNSIASHFVGNNTLICIVGKDIKSSFIESKSSKKANFLQNLNLAGSTLQKLLGNTLSGELKPINLESELKLWEFLKECTQTKLLLSAKDIASGGICIALAKMAILGNKSINAFLNFSEIMSTDYSKILNQYKRQIQNIITRIYKKFDEKEFEIFLSDTILESKNLKSKKNTESKKSSKIHNSKDSINSNFIDSIQSIFNANLSKNKITDSIIFNLLNSISNMQNNERILSHEIIRDFLTFSNIESISLFSQNHTQIICEVFPHNLGIIKEIARQNKLECHCIGFITQNSTEQAIKIAHINLSLKTAHDLYFNSFESKICK